MKGNDYSSQLESVAHESFHALQDDEGQGGASIINEVEANIFAGRIQQNYSTEKRVFASRPATSTGNNTEAGKLYQAVMDVLVYNEQYNPFAFIAAVMTFRNGSETGGLYKSYKFHLRSYKKNLIKEYLPPVYL